jgi:hypothetical protein
MERQGEHEQNFLMPAWFCHYLLACNQTAQHSAAQHGMPEKPHLQWQGIMQSPSSISSALCTKVPPFSHELLRG